jgi:NADPH-dependent ferric siderophore reductase
MTHATDQLHQIERVRRQPKRRQVEVIESRRLTPHMQRITFASPELADFESAGPDDHVRLIVPDAASADGFASRDYTPRAFDPKTGELTIDFALHVAGPATAWALAAKPGDRVQIGGPRGSQVVADDFDYYMLIGDETALPAIGRRIEGLRPGVPVWSLVVTESAEDRQTFATKADWQGLWVDRASTPGDDAQRLLSVLSTWQAPAGDGYVWFAAEAQVARALRHHVLEERQHPAAWFKAAGYWVLGSAGASDKMNTSENA